MGNKNTHLNLSRLAQSCSVLQVDISKIPGSAPASNKISMISSHPCVHAVLSRVSPLEVYIIKEIMYNMTAFFKSVKRCMHACTCARMCVCVRVSMGEHTRMCACVCTCGLYIIATSYSTMFTLHAHSTAHNIIFNFDQ